MLRGGSDAVIPLGVQIEGTDEAIRYLDVISARIDKMNQGASAVPGGSSGFGSLTPSGAPRPGSGLEGYAGGVPYNGVYGTPLAGGPNQGVLVGGPVYSPANLLAPGALAPNPLTGQATSGTGYAGGSGGTTTIMASNVTIVGAGGGNAGGGYGGAGYGGGHGGVYSGGVYNGGGYTSTHLFQTQVMPTQTMTTQLMPTMAGAGGNPSTASFNWHPLPGWNPFGNDYSHKSFVQSFRQYAANGPGGEGGGVMGGLLGQRFLQSGLGGNMAGLVQQYEAVLPAGWGEAAGAVMGKLALPLGVAAIGRDLWAAGAHASSEYQQPGIFQDIREQYYNRSGTNYDPIQLKRDRRMAKIEAWERGVESVYNTPFFRASRFINPWLEYEHDTSYRRKLETVKGATDANARFEDLRRDFLFSTGTRVPDRPPGAMLENDIFGSRVAYTRGLPSAFQYGQAKNAYYMDYSTYGRDYGGSPDLIGGSAARIGSYMMRPGYETAAASVMRGMDVRGYFPQALSSAIAHSDYDTLKAFGPEFTRIAGGDIGRGLAMQQAAMKRALSLQAAQTSGAVGLANFAAGQSDIGFLSASGASGYEIASATSRLSFGYDAVIKASQAKLAAEIKAGNPLDIARARAEFKQAVTTQQELRKQAEMQRFSVREQEIGTAFSFAGSSLTRSMYGTSEGAVLGAFGRQGDALRDRASLLRDKARSPFISPEERKGYLAELAGVRNEIEFSLPRQMGDFRFGMREGYLGIRGARAGAASEHAGLYGGVEEQYKTSLDSAGITRSQLALVRERLAGDYGPQNMQERLDLQKQAVDLQRQLNTQLEQATRSFATANLSVAQFSQGMASSSANYRQSFFGVGGAAAGQEHGAIVAGARSTLAIAQKNLADVQNLPKDNAFRQQREREFMDAKSAAQEAVQGYAQLPISVGLQRESMAERFRFDAMTRTFMPWGDQRGALENMMKNTGAQGKEIRAQQRQGIAAIDADRTLTAQEKAERKAVLNRDFEGRLYGLGSELIGLEQQYQTGWQDKIISQTVGMPGRGTFVASQFTRREAAPFVQGLTSVFGFSGAGAESYRDNWMFRGPRIANSTIGNITRPEGFVNTGMDFAAAGGHGQVLRPSVGGGGRAGSTANVEGAARTLVDAIIALVGNGGSGNSNPFGMGGSSQTLHHVVNTRNIGHSEHANGTSHQ